MVVVLGRLGDGRFCSCGDDSCVSCGRYVWWLWYVGMVVVVVVISRCGSCDS